MTRSEIETKVRECLRQVAEEQGITVKSYENDQKIVDDLGFKSLDVATLTAFLEAALHVDPFSTEMAVITEIQTVQDVYDVYDRCLNGRVQNKPADDSQRLEDARLQRRLGKKTA